MNKIILIISFLFITVTRIQAQTIGHDLTIFAEEGELFILIINGAKINEQPQASVSVQNITSNNVNAKIVFADENIPVIEKKYLLLAEPGVGDKRPVATVYKIKKKKEEYKLSFVSRSPKTLLQNNVIIINN
jgi:hypothetical protein